MSLSALNASLGGAPPPAEHPRDLGGKSAGGAKFDAFVSALASEDLQPNASGAGAAAAVGGQDRVSASQNAPKSYESQSIDGGLAGLLSGAIGSSAAAAGQSVSRSVRKENTALQGASESSAAGSTAGTGTNASLTLAGLLSGALASSGAATPGQFVWREGGKRTAAQQDASASASAATLAPTADTGANASLALAGLALGVGALASSGAGTSDQLRASVAGGASTLAVAAGNGGPITVGLAGVVDAPTTIQTAPNGDFSLGVRVVQTRTYLGVDSAARSETGASAWRSLARSAATDAVGSGAAGAVGVAAASTKSDTPPEKGSTHGHGESQGAAPPDQSAGLGSAAVGANASPSAVNAGISPAVAVIGPIACDQLADSLAAEASTLSSQATPSGATSAAGVGKAQAVKELQIQLNPADLGAVSVKMRIAGGQLSVVMEVAKSSTLQSIESERDAIANRLGLSAQSLEILMSKPTATNQTNGESTHASDQGSGSQENAQSDSNRASQGNEQQPSRRDSAAGRWARQAGAQSSSSGRGFGDLLV
ncbi:MAG: flagellar hook-length control protein FliK [Roseiarcus sp.]|jgi:hypothetical protein